MSIEDDIEERDYQIAVAHPLVQNHIMALRDSYDVAVKEIIRLREAINKHTEDASGHVVTNYDFDVVSQVDWKGLTTEVNVRPLQLNFFLAQTLGNWSDMHKDAFGDQIVKRVGHRIKKDVMRSIWGCHARDA